MQKFLLLALLLGLPSHLFADDSKSGYKQEKSCVNEHRKFSLWKKEHTKSKKYIFMRFPLGRNIKPFFYKTINFRIVICH